MIIDAPIDLELTQNSGQTSQPPWKKTNDSYSDLVYINNNPAIFNVMQSGKNIDFSYTGNVTEDTAVEKLKEIYDLDFDLNKFYRYLDSYDELKDMAKFCNGLRLFQAKDPFECVISSICSANNSIKRWTKSISDMKVKWGRNFNNHYSFPDVKIFNDLFLFLDSDPQLIDYTLESINRTLRNEFSNQIQPVKNPSCLSKIEIEQDGALLFSFSIKENNIIKEEKPVFYNSPFNNVFLIDNPFVLDNLSSRSFFPKFYSDDTSFFFNSILNHEDKLKQLLLKKNDITIFEQVILDKQLKLIKNQLNKILPGNYEFSDELYKGILR